MRDLLVQRLRPISDRFVADLSSIMEKQVDRVIEEMFTSVTQAFDIALSAVASGVVESSPGADVVALVVQAIPDAQPRKHQPRAAKPKPTKPEPPKPATPITAVDPSRKRGPYHCKKCGAAGFRADGCGRTHNVSAISVESSSDDDSEDEPRAPQPTRRRLGRARAELEERVIPHLALVAMLAADRAHNAVGDAGGFVARKDLEPSLVGHTEERRELCPVHGWVGRLAFDRDRHDMCEAPTEELAAPKIADEHPVAVEHVKLERNGTNRHRARTADRAYTIPQKRLTREALRLGWIDVEQAGPAVDEMRPTTRGECRDAHRPCPWVSCKHHLFLDVDVETGSIKINFPDVEPEELLESCSLDIAERGGLTLEDTANLMNLTRERARQVELKALTQIKPEMEDEG